ncbi:MAG: flavodoxin domain-containing protein [Nocardioides sp.]|jgi:flavodoxin-like protein
MSTPLHALVVYESMFGNTEEIAECIAQGLRLADIDVEVMEVGKAPKEIADDTDLLVVGAPTHAFSLSRPSTRADAVRQGAPEARQQLGVREWLAAVAPPKTGCNVATFDTRAAKVRRFPRAAGPRAAKLARRRGFSLLEKPAGFVVDDLKGPLADHEAERAVEWGRNIAGLTRSRVAATQVSTEIKDP